MAQYEWSEVFMSIEGEARYSGHPTVYIRFARCNFSCPLFNNHNKVVLEDGYAPLTFDPKHYETLQEIPLIETGCDSQYAVNPKFSHMWHKGDEKALAAEILKVLPHNTFQNPATGKRVILSLTGGEPTIRLKFWVPILEELYRHGMRTVLIETNCAAPMRDTNITDLYQWAQTKWENDSNHESIKFIWSNSPKLQSSGEQWDKAIKPNIATMQLGKPTSITHVEIEQYFKFVVRAEEEDFAEIAKAMNEYYSYQGNMWVSKDTDVYCMPVACTEEQQQEISAKVAQMCIDRGYIYAHRIQNSVFGNGVGT